MQLGMMSAYEEAAVLKKPISTTKIAVNQAYINKCMAATTKSVAVSTAQTAAASGSLAKSAQGIETILNAMEEKFKKLALTVPKAKCKVKAGDTLQKLSVSYYGTADNWEKIYTHNKLSSTALVTGAILEIPNL
jgi:nucleoid-associated protein YgaU